MSPDFKILQFDWSTLGIRTNQANDSTIIEDDSKNENKSNPKENAIILFLIGGRFTIIAK